MSALLPPVPPLVAAEAVEGLPTRLRARLDQVVEAARDWPITSDTNGFTVRVDEATTVHLGQTVGTAEDVRCSCLLAPHCLHRAAVLSLAPSMTSVTDDLTAVKQSTVDTIEEPVTLAESRAAWALWAAAATVLDTGIPGAGAVPQAALLRAAHQARAIRLHRAASAAIRLVEHLRAAARESPAFRLDDLVRDLRELLVVSHGLRTERAVPRPGLRGTARREYKLAGSGRLYGLCTEPVVTASGYGGAATILVDDAGTFWQVADVVPGGADLALLKANTSVTVGEARLTHRELGRAGLLTTDLRASDDGRISAGRSVLAVRADGVAWSQPPLEPLWDKPLPDQLARYHASLELAPSQRPAGAGLLFVTGTVLGATRDGVLVGHGERPILIVAPTDTPALPYVDNLRLLAHAVGVAVRFVGRPAGRRRIAAIAVGGAWVPARFGGHIDLGLDRMERADVPGRSSAPTLTWHRPDDSLPMHPLQRRLERAVEGGRSAVRGDPAELRRLHSTMPHAAELAERLEAAARPRRDSFGRIANREDDDFATAWLAGAAYLNAAMRSAATDDWR